MAAFIGFGAEFDKSVLGKGPLKILYFTNPEPDYLADSFFLGLKAQPGVEVYQSTIKNVLYKDYPADKTIYGKGFTLYRQLDRNEARAADLKMLESETSFYDLIIFSS